MVTSKNRIISQIADGSVFRAGRDDAAAVLSTAGGSQAAGLRGEALLASWPFACPTWRGSFGLSQKNKKKYLPLAIQANSEIEAKLSISPFGSWCYSSDHTFFSKKSPCSEDNWIDQ
ncbi:hypothetical protein [Algoriphagus sp. AGSA1]|uniref:hypothetical protein n=1 Tax=Algoriphagus sp. AGSA1 TaxID=2907213 RepID=UPI001F1BBC73|nr:hypothetical protein [Algoriphagus sp. AGSA1]